jgi:hypothetical protein
MEGQINGADIADRCGRTFGYVKESRNLQSGLFIYDFLKNY